MNQGQPKSQDQDSEQFSDRQGSIERPPASSQQQSKYSQDNSNNMQDHLSKRPKNDQKAQRQAELAYGKNESKEGEDKNDTPEKDEDRNEDSEEDQQEIKQGNEEKDGSGKRESSDSNRQDNDTSQIHTLVTGKKCFNKLCNSKKIHKKIRSKVETQRYRFLCKNCYDNYVNNSFCQFCEQIYSNYENQQDDTKWVGCDKCERWNHIQCQRKYRHKNFQISKDQYQCLSCAKKNRNPPQDQNQQNSKRIVERSERAGQFQGPRQSYRNAKVQINKDERVPIFHKKPDVFPCLESFLQTYSKQRQNVDFRLWLNDGNIREDIDSLRSLNRRPIIDEEPKKAKKVKTDY